MGKSGAFRSRHVLETVVPMQDFIPIFGITIPFAALVAIILGPGLIKDREKARMQETLRKAIDAGQTLPPEVIDAIARATDVLPTRTRDIRRGVLWLAVAASFTTMGIVANQFSFEDHANGSAVLFGIASLPGFIGLAFLILGLTARKTA